MSEDRRDDLVPVTAIIAGAVVSVAVTVFSLIGIGDELADRFVDDDYPEYLEPYGAKVMEHGMGPLGEMRGPTDLEWEAIRTYKLIENMTALQPADAEVDDALVQLWRFSTRHPENGYLQQLYLKGVRVAQYYAFEKGDLGRSDRLLFEFERHRRWAEQSEGTVLESMRMIVQRLGQSCDGFDEQEEALSRLAADVSDADQLQWIRRDASRLIAFCSTIADG